MPKTGRHKIVLIEAKKTDHVTSFGKIVRQLLKYYTASFQFGSVGLEVIRKYRQEHPEAVNPGFRTVCTLTEGLRKEKAWNLLRSGRPPLKHEIVTYIALDTAPPERLQQILRVHLKEYGLQIGTIAVSARGLLKCWFPA